MLPDPYRKDGDGGHLAAFRRTLFLVWYRGRRFVSGNSPSDLAMQDRRRPTLEALRSRHWFFGLRVGRQGNRLDGAQFEPREKRFASRHYGFRPAVSGECRDDCDVHRYRSQSCGPYRLHGALPFPSGNRMGGCGSMPFVGYCPTFLTWGYARSAREGEGNHGFPEWSRRPTNRRRSGCVEPCFSTDAPRG